jgi:hypothetical protein
LETVSRKPRPLFFLPGENLNPAVDFGVNTGDFRLFG